MITHSQILLSTLILFIVFRTWVAYRKKDLSITFTIVWMSFWLTVMFLIFQQNLVSNLAHKVGISRGVDLVIYISLIASFYLIYKLIVKLDYMETRITKLVRELALKEVKKRK